MYAIGDIHGRLDCLQAIQAKIRQHMFQNPAKDVSVVYLGDYIDRGPSSCEVVDWLIENPLTDNMTYLMGNHEYVLRAFLEKRFPYSAWLRWGGEATIASYNVSPCPADADEWEIDALRTQLHEKIPEKHKLFFYQLKHLHEAGDYVFVHAGLRPEVSIQNQQPEDMLMIREEFFSEPVTVDKTIIHGHTIFKTPYIRDGSIGIDTGAYATGILTAIILENNTYEFLRSI